MSSGASTRARKGWSRDMVAARRRSTCRNTVTPLTIGKPTISSTPASRFRCLSRSFLVARAVGFGSLFWYQCAADPNSLESNYYNYGMWFKDEPLPEVAAYSAVARVVENAAEAKLLDLNSNVKGGGFPQGRRQGRRGALGGREPVRHLPWRTASTAATSWATSSNRRRGTVKTYLPLDGFPVYLETSGSFEALVAMVCP